MKKDWCGLHIQRMRKTKKTKAGGSPCHFSLYIILSPPPSSPTLSILNTSIKLCAYHCAPRGRCWYWFSCDITDDLIPTCSPVNVRHYVVHMLCGSHSVLFHPDLFLLFPCNFLITLESWSLGLVVLGDFIVIHDNDFSFLSVIRIHRWPAGLCFDILAQNGCCPSFRKLIAAAYLLRLFQSHLALPGRYRVPGVVFWATPGNLTYPPITAQFSWGFELLHLNLSRRSVYPSHFFGLVTFNLQFCFCREASICY